jgi:teichuronic acid biosynthesis glycosyltransferase TuaG
MPAYNAGKYLNESIESVIGQTYADWELIIVDDGSTDSTATIATGYAASDPRIKYFYQEQGRQGKARNLAINNSRGYYLAFLDADDIWVNHKLQTQIDILKSRPGLDLICSQGYYLYEDGKPDFFYTTIKEWSWEADGETFIKMNQVAILSAVVKRAAVIDVGLFTEDPSIQNIEDYHLWLKLLSKGYRFLSTPDFLFYYRVHQAQSTHNGIDYQKLLNCYLDLIENKQLNINSPALKSQLKWMIFKYPDLNDVFEKLKLAFPKNTRLLNFFIRLNRLFPDRLILKKAAFHAL